MDPEREEEVVDYGENDAAEAYSEPPQEDDGAAAGGNGAGGDDGGADGEPANGAPAAMDEDAAAAAPAAADGDGAGEGGQRAEAGGKEGGEGARAKCEGGGGEERGGGGAAGDERDPLKLPPHGTEVFVASLPHEASEDRVREFIAGAGLKTHSVRIPRPGPDAPRSSHNKGFAFAVYSTKEDAAAAVEALNGKSLGERTIRASISVTNNRLFIGNIPRTMSGPQLKEALAKEVVGLEEVDLVMDRDAPEQSRGFGFLTFYNHAAAERARRTLEAGFSVGMRPVNVSWAEVKKPDDTSVRAVYVGGIPQSAKADAIKELFAAHGEVEEVALLPSRDDPSRIRDFCFVHFKCAGALCGAQGGGGGGGRQAIARRPGAERVHGAATEQPAAAAARRRPPRRRRRLWLWPGPRARPRRVRGRLRRRRRLWRRRLWRRRRRDRRDARRRRGRRGGLSGDAAEWAARVHGEPCRARRRRPGRRRPRAPRRRRRRVRRRSRRRGVWRPRRRARGRV
ncbi:MAG: hypothetical protein J3K34DRAFT_108797 [Monoraphidium minutum]|nr:MAG: hypothetical protein J3K34DRAFT_108797 [Monoraphidium minutum]